MAYRNDKLAAAKWNDLAEPQPHESKTAVERANYHDLNPLQRKWRDHGFVVLENFMDHRLLDAYSSAREAMLPKDRSARDNFWGGWADPTPYLRVPEMRDIILDKKLMNVFWTLFATPMAPHLCLTGWVSTERAWHQDTYLNPSFLWSHYGAIWFALDDIEADAGPFEYVPGSHKWSVLRQEKLFGFLTHEERTSADWPKFTQGHIGAICEREIDWLGARTEKFMAKKGDVLIWHSNLVHRGSPPNNPDLLRKALICHYSSIERRVDMKRLRRHDNGFLYFDF